VVAGDSGSTPPSITSFARVTSNTIMRSRETLRAEGLPSTGSAWHKRFGRGAARR
jgi:hypothetical protein